MNRLADKVAIVTGAGQGLGLAIAKLFASEGATVVGTGRHVAKIQNAFDAVLAENPDYTMVAMQHEVSSRADWQAVVSETVEKFGRVDVLVNNAAVTSGKTLADIDEDAFLNVFKINAMGELLGVQTVAPAMEAIGGGSIVVVSSIAALVTGDADNNDPAYSASKGATRALTRHCAYQLAPKGIRVNGVFPGPIETPLLTAALAENPDIAARVKQLNPLAPHVSTADDIANAVLFLASDDARTVTGAELVVDCGHIIH